jgi:hypothetical protein
MNVSVSSYGYDFNRQNCTASFHLTNIPFVLINITLAFTSYAIFTSYVLCMIALGSLVHIDPQISIESYDMK